MGIQSCMVSPCLPEPQSGTLLHPCGKAAFLQEQEMKVQKMRETA